MLHRLFVLVVVTGTMGCSESALPEELVVRLDRTVRSTDRGWMFDSVGRGETGTLFRWTRVSRMKLISAFGCSRRTRKRRRG